MCTLHKSPRFPFTDPAPLQCAPCTSPLCFPLQTQPHFSLHPAQVPSVSLYRPSPTSVCALHKSPLFPFTDPAPLQSAPCTSPLCFPLQTQPHFSLHPAQVPSVSLYRPSPTSVCTLHKSPLFPFTDPAPLQSAPCTSPLCFLTSCRRLRYRTILLKPENKTFNCLYKNPIWLDNYSNPILLQ